ncbi:hypothetical protein N8Z76_00335 [Gammaproteobacteria bacterium]|nr:hypothetical protein [Gammaproteobacteria bacterium]
MGVNWIFKGNYLAIFLAWYKYRLYSGRDSFTINLPLGRDTLDGAEAILATDTSILATSTILIDSDSGLVSGASDYTARFVDGKLSVKLKELPSTWSVSARLEVFN